MTSGWAITQGATTVNLPVAPTHVRDSAPPRVDEGGIDGGSTILISRFTMARTLLLEGSIWVHGQTNAQLESAYLAPLRAMTRLVVTITDPDSQFGGNWVMIAVQFDRVQEGGDIRYKYSLSFKQGVSIIQM